MKTVLIDKSLDRETWGRDYIIDRVIGHINKSKKCHSYILINKPETEDEKEEATSLFGEENLGKRIFYSWICQEDKEMLLISSLLNKYDKIDIEFGCYECDTEIKVEPDKLN